MNNRINLRKRLPGMLLASVLCLFVPTLVMAEGADCARS